jgi:DNA-directed RNA polymerase specialized sigma24 family protein
MSKRDPSSSLSQSSLDQLLQQFDTDRDRAAQRYIRVRERLIHYFTLERCTAPAEHADDVLDRVARRISEGEAILSIDAYIAGVARLVGREVKKAAFRSDEQRRRATTPPTAEAEDEEALHCLEAALEQLPPETRAFILAYYSGDGQNRIENRKRMAQELGTGLNALRNRALRLRSHLQEAVQDCLGRGRDTRDRTATQQQRANGGSTEPTQ